MQGESGSEQLSHPNLQPMNNGDSFVFGDDLGKFVGDASFSDVTSDDSSGWMHKIDVTNFQRLTSTSSAADAAVLQGSTLLTPGSTLLGSNNEAAEVKVEIGDETDDQRNWFNGIPVESDKSIPRDQPILSSSRPYEAVDGQFGADTNLPPPRKKCRQRESSSSSSSCLYNDKPNPCGASDQRQQISVVSSTTDVSRHIPHRQYPKPVYSYSCVIALALKNSQTGRLQVAEIYNFMCENYPYFRTAPAGWKNSVRHNLSLNKCFEKIEVEAPGGHGRKCCLWTLNPLKAAKMDQEIRKYREKDPIGIREAYARPEDMELIEQGLKGMPSKPNMYHSGQAVLPDVVQQTAIDGHGCQKLQIPTLMTVDTTLGGTFGSIRPSAAPDGASELALKLLQQAACYRQQQRTQHASNAHGTLNVGGTSASWIPSQLENNRTNVTPSLVDQCPLDMAPFQYIGDRSVMSTPPCSTPIRHSPLAAYSPYSYPYTDRDQRLHPSHHQYSQGLAHSSTQRQSPMSRDGFTSEECFKHWKTPERPASCGYFGGNNSVLVTPPSESHQHPQHRRCVFGTPLDAAFCAATVHNNSLLTQSMQYGLNGQEEQQSSILQHQGAYPLVFQPVSSSPSNGTLHLTPL